MGQVRSSKTVTDGAFFVQTSVEDQATEGSPERTLWAAILLVFIRDYEDLVKRITSGSRQAGRPVMHLKMKWRIQAMYREGESLWMQTICHNAGLLHGSLLKILEDIDDRHELDTVRWVNELEITFNDEWEPAHEPN